MQITGIILTFCNSVAIYLLKSFICDFIRSDYSDKLSLVFIIIFGIIVIISVPLSIRYIIRRIRGEEM